MAINLQNKPNVVAPNTPFPYGAIKDDSSPGANDGTPVNTVVYGDFHQFFAKMMAAAGIAYNNLVDNFTNGFQYFTALSTLISNAVSAEATARANADSTLTSNLSSEASTRASADTAEATARANADNSIISGLDIGTTSWITSGLSYGSGVTSGPTNAFAYKKVNGVMYFTGQVQGTIGSGSTLFTLPSGYRPSKSIRHSICAMSVGAYGYFIDINTSGVVTIFGYQQISTFSDTAWSLDEVIIPLTRN